MNYLIKGGRVIDPAHKVDCVSDLLIADGKIERIGKDLPINHIIDAGGRIVAPGLVDMHAHLREPGREDEETIATGTRAAIRGGFTSIACMANTEPALDSPAIAKTVKKIIKKNALSNIFMIGAITEGRAGRKLTDLAGMKQEGIVAVSDDGACVQDTGLMTEAMKSCAKLSLLLIDHCEDSAMTAGGVMNRGFVSTEMGLRGMPREAEYEIVKRDLEVAAETSARIHIAHVSCKGSTELIRQAKRKGVRVTAETAPHYFTLTEECCVTYDTNTKMNPPLRTKEDVEAIKAAIADGTIDAIATDHAPHTDSEKYVEFDHAPFGIIGLETALSLAVMELIDRSLVSWPDLIQRMSTNPAKILGIERGSLKEGGAADVVVIDPAKEYLYTRDLVESKSRNSPFIGWKLKAKVTHVFVAGRMVMEDGAITQL